ncbi:DUF4013 domain-containing protein [Halobacteriaceae archaeon GCM10025711]
MLEEALSYPTRGDRSIGRIIVGGLLVLFSFLIVPGLAALGYYVKVLGATSHGEQELPAFEDWGALIVTGLKAFVISFVYGIIPYFAFMLVGGLFGAGDYVGSGAGSLLTGVGLLVLLVGMVLAFAVQYVLPAALTSFAREGRLAAAFDFDAMKPVLTNNGYIIAVVLVFALAVGVAFLVAVATMFTFGLALLLFVPLGPFFYFWLYLVGAYMFGTAYGDAASGRPAANTAAVSD